MRCEQCRRNNQETLYPYGGMQLCFHCNETHNPQVDTVKRLDKHQRERLEDRVSKLQKELRIAEHQLKIDKQLEAKGQQSVDFIIPRERKF